jgi:hypothetical protein
MLNFKTQDMKLNINLETTLVNSYNSMIGMRNNRTHLSLFFLTFAVFTSPTLCNDCKNKNNKDCFQMIGYGSICLGEKKKITLMCFSTGHGAKL